MGNQEFARLAVEAVRDYRKEHDAGTGDIYVVWLSKVLQNNKALLSTTDPDGMYYEVTYNGDKREMYLDAYKKQANVCIHL